ncbi:alginate export family protein [Marinicella sp. S1101]|uniref:alginate export family protein n=1 Tax=Marinicella marina TaxID=2996016 RepID=UPI002260D883|nr:alginate export family protein [Marinicella marina]MCX7552441.1 alginate export family protein [Marinicella marina]MDJ1139316.1 alginate export family protein [Marinicella marina]
MNKKKNYVLAALGLGMMSLPVWSAESLSEAFNSGDANLSFRYRLEHVDQDGFDRNANASTLLTRLDYKTATYKGFNFFIEADNVMEVFGDNYNAAAGNTPNNGQYPVVADPTGTEINQAWFNYAFNANNDLKIGRQRIILDNQRFVGGVGWRQNEQTYDAVSFNSKIAGSKLFLSYIENVNRIFGEDVAAGDHDNQSFLANWSNTWQDRHQLTTYYYNLDNQDAAAFSTATFGAAFKTHWPLAAHKMTFGAEFASQSDAHNNPVNYDANYLRLDLGLALEKVTFFTGYEVLEGDTNQAGAAFRTPLATLHAFNGWADQFLATPNQGLEDVFIGAKGNIEGFNWQVIYHQFDAESGSGDFGNELDFSVAKKLNKNFSMLFKAAQYDAQDIKTDSNKYWLMLSAKY